MMDQREAAQAQLFYEFNLNEIVPEDHPLRQSRSPMTSMRSMTGSRNT